MSEVQGPRPISLHPHTLFHTRHERPLLPSHCGLTLYISPSTELEYKLDAVPGLRIDQNTRGYSEALPSLQCLLEEQRAIADYLDTETGRIDALITKKRRMIELLEERWALRP